MPDRERVATISLKNLTDVAKTRARHFRLVTEVFFVSVIPTDPMAPISDQGGKTVRRGGVS